MRAVDIRNGTGPATSLFINSDTPMPSAGPGGIYYFLFFPSLTLFLELLALSLPSNPDSYPSASLPPPQAQSRQG